MTVRRVHTKPGNGGGSISNVADIQSARKNQGGQETIRDASNRMAEIVPPKIPDQVQVLNLPLTVTYDPASKHLDEPGWYCVEYGKKPQIKDAKQEGKKRRRQVRSKDEELFARIIEVRDALHANALKDSEFSPEQNLSGYVEALATDACDNDRAMDIKSVIDRMGDLVRPFYGPKIEEKWPRHYDPSSDFNYFMPAPTFISQYDELPTAGAILSDDSRLIDDKVFKTTSQYRAACDDLEPLIAAVGALRSLGWDSYLALAKSKEEISLPDGTRSLVDMDRPVVAVFDPKGDVPLYTTLFAPDHPSVTALEIFSDKEVLSLLHALRAQMRMRRMFRDMKVREGFFDDSVSLSDDLVERDRQITEMSRSGPMTVAEMGKHIIDIAESLFESFQNSETKKFFLNALMYAKNNVFETVVKVRSHRVALQLRRSLEDCVAEANKYALDWQNAGFFGKIILWFKRPKFLKLMKKDAKNVGKAADMIIEGIDAHLERKVSQLEAEQKALASLKQ